MRLFHASLAIIVLLSSFSTSCLTSSSALHAQGFRARMAASPKSPKSAPVVSPNFVVHAPDPILARKISSEAERFRKELSVDWLGHELPNWDKRCPITVELKMHAGGETSFAFVMNQSGRSTPIDWKMKLFGPANRILDAVLPHEITHTIFATHFGQPLPRWADEGACTTVEHESERKKNHQMLMDFLSSSPSRGLPFNRMFTMRNYPHDILPLYAQGYSLAKFLILQKGKRHFVDYVGKGLQNETKSHALTAWNRATAASYDYKDLSDLQLAWLDWVRKGSDETVFNDRTPPTTYVSNPITKNLKGNEIVTAPPASSSKAASESGSPADGVFASRNTGSWYAQQMKSSSQTSDAPAARVAARRENLSRKPEAHRDSSLPAEFRPAGGTIWR